jgi:hypothetical protein
VCDFQVGNDILSKLEPGILRFHLRSLIVFEHPCPRMDTMSVSGISYFQRFQTLILEIVWLENCM